MTKNTALRAGLAILILVLGNLQVWDSNVPDAGLLIVLIVSLATALPPVALLAPMEQQHFAVTVVLSMILLVFARLVSPIPLPGLFIILVPAVMGLIFTGLIKQET